MHKQQGPRGLAAALRHTPTSVPAPKPNLPPPPLTNATGRPQVRCPDDCPSAEGGITLHLYAPPIRRVKLYEPESNRVVNRTPGFFTIRGKKLRDRK